MAPQVHVYIFVRLSQNHDNIVGMADALDARSGRGSGPGGAWTGVRLTTLVPRTHPGEPGRAGPLPGDEAPAMTMPPLLIPDADGVGPSPNGVDLYNIVATSGGAHVFVVRREAVASCRTRAHVRERRVEPGTSWASDRVALAATIRVRPGA